MAEPVPYANATSGADARRDVTNLLRRLGCDKIGFMDDFARRSVVLEFEHRGRRVSMAASADGWAVMYLRSNPWNPKRRSSREEWEAQARRQGMVAVNSILRDWVKGQVTAIECGIFSFATAFAVHMIGSDGRPLLESMSLLQIEDKSA